MWGSIGREQSGFCCEQKQFFTLPGNWIIFLVAQSAVRSLYWAIPNKNMKNETNMKKGMKVGGRNQNEKRKQKK
jgi:hypothetical protein